MWLSKEDFLNALLPLFLPPYPLPILPHPGAYSVKKSSALIYYFNSRFGTEPWRKNLRRCKASPLLPVLFSFGAICIVKCGAAERSSQYVSKGPTNNYRSSRFAQQFCLRDSAGIFHREIESFGVYLLIYSM